MPLLSCTAEEVALHALIKKAEEILEMDNEEFDLEAFYDVAFQDLDYQLMYEPALDGVEDTELGTERGMSYLHFSTSGSRPSTIRRPPFTLMESMTDRRSSHWLIRLGVCIELL